MIALRFERSVPRYLASKAVGRRAAGLVPRVAPLRLGHYDEPDRPADGWVRVAPVLSGICGSDLAMLSGDASFYFSPLTSMPFVPGHEIVGTTLEATSELDEGTRIVVEPVLACAARGLQPGCPACARGDTGLCERTAHGHLAPGLQTGFCEDTGGGWGQAMWAHTSQIHPIADDLSDEDAVMVEPLACAIHAALRGRVADNDTVLISGAGTMGLLTIAAVREAAPGSRIIAVAKHPRQRTEAEALGADVVCTPRDAHRAVRLATGSMLHTPERGQPWTSGGVDVAFECVGSAAALETCLRVTRPRGRVVLVGLPGASTIDMAPVWHRELEVVGAYTYGAEEVGGERVRTFDVAVEAAKRLNVGRLVSARYPLSRYQEAIDHAQDAGALGAIKVAFELETR